MTVEEMLSRISSIELSEWRAFEELDGPLGRDYLRDALADLIDVMSRKDETSPRYPKAHQVADLARRQREAQERAEEAGEQAAQRIADFNRHLDQRFAKK